MLLFSGDVPVWRILLDVLFVNIGLFYLQRTLLRLGTWKIMAGILMALIVFLLAHFLDLKGIEWIYNNVSHVAFIGLIIIFQPELRKVLERSVWLAPGKGMTIEKQIPVLLAEVLFAMAKESCGALIVLPGRESIKEKISGGFQLDAVPSYPLIISIFDDTSPGHDGAILIEESRISRFGVRLPISASSRLSNAYGTRHHAAMGLSEQTDSLVFVVSEERGQVSAFYEAKMQILTTKQEVIDLINEHFQQAGKKRSSKRLTLSRLALVQGIISLGIASFFSLMILRAQQDVVERTIVSPINYHSVPADGSVLVGDKQTEVKLHLSGPRTAMDALNQNPPNVFIDLGLMHQGKQTVIVTSENLKLPKDVNLLDVSPGQLDLTLAPMLRTSLSITPQLIGNLPPGLQLKKVTIKPEAVPVTMPKSKKAGEADKIMTTPIYLNSISANSALFCGIVARPSIQPIGGQWPDIEVFVEVEANPAEKKK